MALKFYLLKIKNLIRETHDTVSITFEIPNDLKSTFAYKQGQYVTLKVPINGVENRRAYSICSSPVNGEDLTIAVKKVDDGVVSRYLNDSLKVGDYLEIMPPMGNFVVEVSADSQKQYVMIGAGSGITPLMSMIKTILHIESKSKVTLIYQNRNSDTIIFQNELEKLSVKYGNRFLIIHVLSRPERDWSGLSGRLNAEKIKKLVSDIANNDIFSTQFYLCGPQGMMHEAEVALKQLNVATHQIHKESFTAPLPKIIDETEHNILLKQEEELITRIVKLRLYGENYVYEVEPDETVLTAAMREGYDPPFSCQIGACSTCRAKLISGKVLMDERDSLTDDEIEEGFILTCQSHPLTDDVMIDYDQN
jgi:ring-1,2-phenylacetyl-CoA epoxidase subunit PaaE